MRERFTLLLDQYTLAPDVTRKRLWLETVQQVLSENRKVVGGDGRQLIYVPMPAAANADNAAAAPVLPADIVAPTVNATTGDVRPERSPASHRPRGAVAMKFPAWIPLAIALLLALIGSVYVVTEGQSAIVLNLGKVVRSDVGPGPALQDGRSSKARACSTVACRCSTPIPSAT